MYERAGAATIFIHENVTIKFIKNKGMLPNKKIKLKIELFIILLASVIDIKWLIAKLTSSLLGRYKLWFSIIYLIHF